MLPNILNMLNKTSNNVKNCNDNKIICFKQYLTNEVENKYKFNAVLQFLSGLKFCISMHFF